MAGRRLAVNMLGNHRNANGLSRLVSLVGSGPPPWPAWRPLWALRDPAARVSPNRGMELPNPVRAPMEDVIGLIGDPIYALRCAVLNRTGLGLPHACLAMDGFDGPYPWPLPAGSSLLTARCVRMCAPLVLGLCNVPMRVPGPGSLLGVCRSGSMDR